MDKAMSVHVESMFSVLGLIRDGSRNNWFIPEKFEIMNDSKILKFRLNVYFWWILMEMYFLIENMGTYYNFKDTISIFASRKFEI